MTLVHNESVKLLAATINNVGIASIVTGVVAPSAGFIYGVGQPMQSVRVFGAVLAWLAVGVGLHLISQRVLRRPKE